MPTPKAKTKLFFSGVGHGVKRPKPKRPSVLLDKKNSPTQKVKHIRQVVNETFDFSRTPYATPKRIALDENSCKKRKFFKSTVSIAHSGKTTDDVFTEFDCDNDYDIDTERIHNHVDKFLKDWNSSMEPRGLAVTRQQAAELESESIESISSYLKSTAYNSPKNQKQLSKNVSSHTSNHNSPAGTFNLGTPLTRATKQVPTSRVGSEIVNSGGGIAVCNSKPQAYSIFSIRDTKKVLSDVTNKKSRVKASLVKAAASIDQYQIDAGQILIGPIECSGCGMVYDRGDTVDEFRHTEYHEKKKQLRYKVSKDENIVGRVGSDFIILIKHSDDKKRSKVEDILRATEEDIGYGYMYRSSSSLYIYVSNDRVLGCLMAEPKVKASRRLESNGINLVSNDEKIVKCGINRIWVQKTARKQKIATELMNCLRKNFIYGDYLVSDEIAFSATTSDGHGFAKKYIGREDYLMYLESCLTK